MLSCTLNKCVSRAIFDSLHCSSPPPFNSVDPTSFLSAKHVSSTLAEANGAYGMRLFPFTGGFQRSPLTHPSFLPTLTTTSSATTHTPTLLAPPPPLFTNIADASSVDGAINVSAPPLAVACQHSNTVVSETCLSPLAVACQHPNTGVTETCNPPLSDPPLLHSDICSPKVNIDVRECVPATP